MPLENVCQPGIKVAKYLCHSIIFQIFIESRNNQFSYSNVNEFLGKRCEGSPVKPGSMENLCGGRFKGFTFNSKTSKCEPFAAVGCELSENGFESEKMCQRTCRKSNNHKNSEF